MFSCALVVLAFLALISKPVQGQYTLTAFVGTGTQGNSGDNGQATSADVNFIANSWVDTNGVTFVVDYSSNVIRQVAVDGIITTIGGTGVSAISNTGGAFTSVALYSPWGVNGDSTYLYFSDNYHVWKYTRATGIVAILAGTGTQGTTGDGGPGASAQINKANGLWMNSDNCLYIAEYGNNLLRKIDLSTTVISTVAGGGGSGIGGDGGPALSTNTKFNAPQGVYIDTNGVIFVSDRNNARVRYIVNGIINTYAGGGPSSNVADGFVGTNAYFSSPFDVKGDTIGNIFVVEGSNKVKVVDYATKAVTTYLSTGLNAPRGIWLDYMNGRSIISMLGYAKTAPLYVNPVPSESPTAMPTFTATASPSALPTITPSETPSAAPTFVPTATPTASPSQIPTATPTMTPSKVPTAVPTNSPTFVPSAQPTIAPTATPTVTPTQGPTTPTMVPTQVPTAQPTYAPSALPSSEPTSRPSGQPSSRPSSQPSGQPTMSPTAPTFKPTRAPSFSPTVKNDDVVKVSGTSRVKFVNGQTLNDLSLATLLSAFQNISDNAQSTVITSTVLVSTSVRRGLVASVSAQAIPNQPSYVYDIGFLASYVMTYHPGYTSSQLAATKTTTIRSAIEVGQFEGALRYLAQARNATQLLNGSCSEVTSLTSVVVPSSSTSSSSSNDDDKLSKGAVAGIVIGILGGCLLLAFVLYVILKKYDDEKKREELSVERKNSGHFTAL